MLTEMTAADIVTLLSPILAVFATYLIAREDWSKLVKALVAFLLSAGMGALIAYAEGSLVTNFWDNFVTIYTIAQGVYWSVFKGLGLEQYLKAVTKKD